MFLRHLLTRSKIYLCLRYFGKFMIFHILRNSKYVLLIQNIEIISWVNRSLPPVIYVIFGFLSCKFFFYLPPVKKTILIYPLIGQTKTKIS